jgi:uncharacterized protein (DUF1786 family)
MKILAVDVGTGTQDILLFDSDREIENTLKLVMPSPTALVADKIRAATARRQSIVLSGVMMGGGPCAWAAEAHTRAGGRLLATPDAARTFNDELDVVEKQMGVKVVSDDEAVAWAKRDGVAAIRMRDIDLDAIRAAFAAFGVTLQPDALALAVFDHGNAPPGYSDRQFRFDYIQSQISNRQSPFSNLQSPISVQQLARFAFRRQDIPARMTRFEAVARSANFDGPMLLMDTAPAAVLGALEDPSVHRQERLLIANVGNFHTLAFRLGPEGIEGVFEHHTGELTRAELEAYLEKLAAGTLTHQEVFADMGHGAVMLDPQPAPIDFLTVTGPRWSLIRGSALKPYFAAPYGDMMMAGNYGLLRAYAEHVPEAAGVIGARLHRGLEIILAKDGLPQSSPR